MYSMIYSFDLILAALLILVGICMILIALLVLRFTLLFTMEEEYREIGIMKAIGLRDKAIRRLYLVKYISCQQRSFPRSVDQRTDQLYHGGGESV